MWIPKPEIEPAAENEPEVEAVLDPNLPAPHVPDARAKPLTRRLPAAAEVPAVVPARMVNEVLYCERLMYLEWVQGEFADNFFTVDGRAVHQRPDQGKKPLKAPRAPAGVGGTGGAQSAAGDAEDDEGAAIELVEERPYTARSVWLTSDRLGLTAKIDVVDVDATGNVVIPVEYKRGKQPEVPDGAYLPERAQLCAQVLLLREHGFTCERADIYFAADRRRVTIDISETLIASTHQAIARAKALAAGAELPPPLVDSPKCNGCSLVGICLPDEVSLLSISPANDIRPAGDGQPPAPLPGGVEEEEEANPWGLRAPGLADVELRRLHPARDERVPLVVQEHGARVGLDGERFVVRSAKGAAAVEARVPNTSELALFGNVYLTTPALRAALDRGIPVSFFTYGGWFLGRAVGFDTKNVELRLAQYAGATDPAVCLALAKGFVVSKISNCRTMLRRNQESPDPVALFELRQLARKSATAGSLESLLGFEGTAARVYFGGFTGMLRGESAANRTFDLEGRNRRPPRDPVNALLSFCYALLSKDFALTLATVGLDPLLGFYHQPRFGRPALALDLMEEFRPLIADSVVISVINNGVVSGDDFVSGAGSVALKPPARKRLILAYERRMDHLVTHPVFGYRVSYRRVLEVQARLLGRYLLGEIPRYPAFRTR